jgi:hypothetical protein
VALVVEGHPQRGVDFSKGHGGLVGTQAPHLDTGPRMWVTGAAFRQTGDLGELQRGLTISYRRETALIESRRTAKQGGRLGQAETLRERRDVVDMGIERIQAKTHGDDRHVRPASVAPPLDFPCELTQIATTQRHIVAAELVD